jgi:hypothetical protein
MSVGFMEDPIDEAHVTLIEGLIRVFDGNASSATAPARQPLRRLQPGTY